MAAAAAAAVLVAVVSALVVSIGFWQQAVTQKTFAQHSAAAAEKAAEKARAVNDFMRDVLTSVEPENQGADVRLIQVLANASETASQRFAGNPEQEAEVRDMLARVYYNLSLLPEAAANYQATLALWRQHAGNDDPRALGAEIDCASMPLTLSQPRESEQLLSELLPRLERILGPGDRKTLLAKRNLAHALLQLGDYEQAERMLIDLRAHPRLADDDAMQVRILQSLIDVSSGRRTGATDASGLSAPLDHEESLCRELIERCVRRFGAEAAITLQAQVTLVKTLAERGQYPQAVDLCRAVLEQTSGRLRDCHDVRVYAMVTLADILTRLGEPSEPADLHLRRIECLRQYMQPNHPSLLAAMRDALPGGDRAGRPVEGEPLAHDLAAAFGQLDGDYFQDLAFESELYAARFISMQDRLDEADPHFHALLARQDHVQDSSLRARVHLFYGSHLTRRGPFEEAERQLQMAVECIGDVRQGIWLTHPDDVILAFIDRYQTWGKTDKIAEYERLRDEVTLRRQKAAAE